MAPDATFWRNIDFRLRLAAERGVSFQWPVAAARQCSGLLALAQRPEYAADAVLLPPLAEKRWREIQVRGEQTDPGAPPLGAYLREAGLLALKRGFGEEECKESDVLNRPGVAVFLVDAGDLWSVHLYGAYGESGYVASAAVEARGARRTARCTAFLFPPAINTPS